MTTIKYVTRDELPQRLEEELGEERMTVDEFLVEGEADTLTDGNLRDLRLHYKGLLEKSEVAAGALTKLGYTVSRPS